MEGGHAHDVVVQDLLHVENEDEVWRKAWLQACAKLTMGLTASTPLDADVERVATAVAEDDLTQSDRELISRSFRRSLEVRRAV